MVKISILHPSRSRPELAKQVYDKWMGNADDKENIEYLFSIDASDPNMDDYMAIMGAGVSHDNTHCLLGLNTSAIEAINNAAENAKGDLLIVVSDDFDCPEHWDTELLKHLEGKTDFCAKTQDGLQQWLITLPIMDRVYYERFGYIYHPEFKHLFCDTLMTVQADLMQKKVDVPMLFPHKHHSQKGGIPKDAVSAKNDATWAQGEEVFLRAAKDNFWLPPELITGTIQDKAMLNWIRQKGVKL